MTLELDDIQGNVLRGYGYKFEHAAYVSLNVLDERDGRGLLGELLPQRHRGHDCGRTSKPSSTLNIAVSHRGLKRLGVADGGARHLPAGVPRRHGAPRRRASATSARARRSTGRPGCGARQLDVLVVAPRAFRGAAARAAGLPAQPRGGSSRMCG